MDIVRNDGFRSPEEWDNYLVAFIDSVDQAGKTQPYWAARFGTGEDSG
ncbi:hypothetical protein ACUXAV_002286 [Cupriavidus metallidurans]|nr:hypothetical protein AU374_03451 [Cupriavidus metallidurans]